MTAFSKGPTRTRRDKPAAKPKSTFVQHPKGKLKDDGTPYASRAPRKPREEGAKWEDRPPRAPRSSDGPRSYGPRRDGDDRPPRRYDSDRPARPRREYGDSPRGPRRDINDPPRGRGGFGEKRFGDRPPRRDYADRAPRSGGGNSDVLDALGKIEAAIKELTKRLTLIENQLEEVFGSDEE
jgi:23S rRNA pseudouridine2604 synthase